MSCFLEAASLASVVADKDMVNGSHTWHGTTQ